MANQKDLANGLIGTTLTSEATTLVLQAGYGDSMPAVPFFLTITPAGQLSTRGNSEIVNVTARTGDTLTIERAQKGTAARAFSIGDIVSNSIYAEGSFDSLDVDGDIYSNGVKVSTYQPLDYSTSEQDTGVKWIDGKTIYKNTVNFGVLPNNTVKHVAHGITGLSWIVRYEFISLNPTGGQGSGVLFANVDRTTTTFGVVNIDATNVSVTTNVDRSLYSQSYITLYYTKT